MSDFLLQRLDHVSLNVSDRPRSIAWYRDVLGLEPGAGRGGRRAGVHGRMGRVHRALPGAVSSAAARLPESVGLRHVAFMVDKADLERLRAHLETSGVDARYEDHGNAHSLYFTDPDGNVIEVTTYEV